MATTSDVTVVTYSGDFRVDSLLDQSADWNFLGPTRTTLYYTFDVAAAELGRHIGTALFSEAQKVAARTILSYVSSVTGIAFAETGSSASADLHFASCNISGASTAGLCETSEAWSHTPANELVTYSAEAYIYLDNVEFASINAAPTAGTSGYEVLLHEVGHALGLGHPFEGPFPLSMANDNTSNTVMSYTHTGGVKSTFQAYDLLALRWLYGEDGLRGAFGFNSTNGPSLTLVDTKPPTVLTFSPTDESNSVAIDANVVMSFSEPIQRGTGSVVLKTAAGVVVASYDATTSTNLSISGSTLTINPTANLANATSYRLEFSAGSIKDLAGNAYGGTTAYNFTTVAAVNHPPSGAISIVGTPAQGQSLSVNTAALVDVDGLGPLAYQWLRSGVIISSATGSSYTLSQSDVGSAVTVRVSYTDGLGKQESMTSTATTAISNVNDTPTGAVSINATAVQGGTLTANTAAIADLDGLGSLQYQWLRDGAAVIGATSSSYGLVQADVGKTIRVRVSYADGGGTNESLLSNTTSSIQNVNDAPVGVVLINGQMSLGQTLTVNTNALSDADGLGAFSYQWLRGLTPILGAIGSSYTVVDTDLGAVLNVRVSYTDGFGALETLTAEPRSKVIDETPPLVTTLNPSDEATGVSVTTQISVFFNESIQRGSGDIVIKTAAGTVVAIYPAATSTSLSFTSNSLSIIPAGPLLAGTSYRVEMDKGIVKDLAGNLYAGTTTYNFTTSGAAGQILTGTAGPDTLRGGVGNDSLNGGLGIDTAVFTGAITSYNILYSRARGSATVTDTQLGRDGTDTLLGIEKLDFAGKTFDLINPPITNAQFGKSQSFLFDPAFYLLKHPDLVPDLSLATAYESYKAMAAQGAAPNAWFDPVYYANRWTDLKNLNLDAATLFAHYNLFGVWEGRSAGPIFDKFDGNAYLAANPDVAAYVDGNVKDFLGNRTNGAIAHYVIYGANEGRIAQDTSGQTIPADFTIAPALLAGLTNLDLPKMPESLLG